MATIKILFRFSFDFLETLAGTVRQTGDRADRIHHSDLVTPIRGITRNLILMAVWKIHIRYVYSYGETFANTMSS